jgi:selenocysteine lyase/cysteine desulfurase
MGYPVAAMASGDFNLDPGIIYLNHAAVSPWPQRTAAAVRAFAAENATLGSRHYSRWVQTEQVLRGQLQRLIRARSTDEIALLKNTSEALSVVAYGLPWKQGDNIVINNQEFPSNRIIWESLAGYGVETRIANLGRETSPEAAILAQIDGRTRLVSVSLVQYGTGLKLDLQEIGQACRERNVLLCVDAIQGLGAVEFDVQACNADFVMADAHKWLLGPEGIALFYCRAEVMEQLTLRQYGWHMVEDPYDFDNREWQPAHSARRFECGSPNMTGIHALHASLTLMEDAGMAYIQHRVLDNSRLLIDFFQARAGDFELITPVEAGRYAGIITFRPRHVSAESLFQRLTRASVMCALRSGGVRFSPHYYTPREQLLQVLGLLEH